MAGLAPEDLDQDMKTAIIARLAKELGVDPSTIELIEGDSDGNRRRGRALGSSASSARLRFRIKTKNSVDAMAL